MFPNQPQSKSAILVFAQGFDRDNTAYGLGPRGGHLVHQALLAQSTSVAGQAADASRSADLVVAHHGRVPVVPQESWRFAQRGQTFGQRLNAALARVAEAGYERVVVVGADSPNLSATDITDAADAERRKLVVGPSDDGGFYLLGIATDQLDVLDGLAWQTERVCGQLVANILDRGLALRLLQRRVDIDTRRDARVCLSRLARLVRRWAGQSFDRLLGTTNPAPTTFSARDTVLTIDHPDRGPPVV